MQIDTRLSPSVFGKSLGTRLTLLYLSRISAAKSDKLMWHLYCHLDFTEAQQGFKGLAFHKHQLAHSVRIQTLPSPFEGDLGMRLLQANFDHYSI